MYLEEIIQNTEETLVVVQDSVKTLIEIYYVLGQFSKCKELSQNFLQKLINNHSSTDEFYKYFSFYQVACLYSPKSRLEDFLSLMKENINESTEHLKTCYFTYFYNGYHIYFKKENKGENAENVNFYHNVLQKPHKVEFPEQYLSQLAYYFVKFVFGIKRKSKENIFQIFKVLSLREEDLIQLEKIFGLIYFISVNTYHFLVGKEEDEKFRTKLLEETNKNLSDPRIRKQLKQLFQ